MSEFFESGAIWVSWIIFGLVFLVFLVTAPCHAVLLLPFVGLPLFWLLPMGYALPINGGIWLATPFLYRTIRKAMRKPLQDGFRSLIGAEAEVVSRLSDHSDRYLVRAKGEGELWSAYSSDVFQVGERAKIVAVKGISVVIERAGDGFHSGEIAAEPGLSGKESVQRNCH